VYIIARRQALGLPVLRMQDLGAEWPAGIIRTPALSPLTIGTSQIHFDI
jgi:hypothetical protein